MNQSNLVVLRGAVRNEPTTRTLPSGGSVTQFDVTTEVAGRSVPVPVAMHDLAVDCREGDQVVVIGHVQRRFFRVGGVTQSRTEVVASAAIRASRKRAIDKALAAASQLLAAAC